MKSLPIQFAALCIFLSLVPFASKAQSNSDFSEVQITKMIKDFYFGYFQLVNNCDPEKVDLTVEKIDSVLNRYCTINLINQIRDVFDYNPFVDSNGFLGSELATLTVAKSHEFDDLYLVSYTSNDQTITTIKLIIKKQNNHYKIDYLWLNHKI